MKTAEQNAPFFIVGAQRSGTTLLRLMLAGHPRLIIPPESHFIPDLYRFEKQHTDLESHRNEIVNWLLKHSRLADFELGEGWIRDALASLHPLSTRNISLLLFAEYARRRGKPRWGDKTPQYRAYLPELYELFPGARFIHLVRDGRDVALSAWRAKFDGPVSWTAAAYLWRDSVLETWRGGRLLPGEAYHEVRYEDLLSSPERTLQRVCDFLAEDFFSGMIQFSENAGQLVPAWEKAWHKKLQGNLDAANAGKWKGQLTPFQVLLFQDVAGKELHAAGFPLLPASPSLVQQVQIRFECLRYRIRDSIGVFLAWCRRAPKIWFSSSPIELRRTKPIPHAE